VGKSAPYLERLRAAKQRSQDAMPEHIALAPEERIASALAVLSGAEPAPSAPLAIRVTPVAPPPPVAAPAAPAKPQVSLGSILGGLVAIFLGMFVLGLGLLATLASQAHATPRTGGMYTAYYGAIFGGGFLVLRGIFRLARAMVTGPVKEKI
jgi:hypothetical protein